MTFPADYSLPADDLPGEPGYTTARYVFVDRGDGTELTVTNVADDHYSAWLEIQGEAVALENRQVSKLIEVLQAIENGEEVTQ